MKRALVTGASGGIGAAIALKLAQDDMYVFVHANKNPDKANLVTEKIKAKNALAESIVFDVTSPKQCEEVLTKLCEKDSIDIIVNNAGIIIDNPMVAMDFLEWQRVIDVSLNGFFNVTKPLLMPMIQKRQGGRIVNITSVTGILGQKGQVNYAAAKAALHGATKSLSLELASRNITVNAVAPGIIDAGMALGKFDDDIIKKVVPMQRAGRAEEVADLVSFLASNKAGYITGQVISINGGMI